MRVRLLTLPFCPALGTFDETPLLELQRTGEVVQLREHWFSSGGALHLGCLVFLRPDPDPPEASEGKVRAKRESTRRLLDELDPASRARFERLREWRLTTSAAEAVPPYVVFTNRQLSEIARRAPATAASLGAIDGVGPSRVKKYGAAVLGLLGHGESARSGAPNGRTAQSIDTRDSGS
ncbi:MAG: HRDC domain-containing protein [Planctomycetota bacterium]